jgi:hypothetical protein
MEKKPVVTDWRIDQVVYRLYGLTQADIALVEVTR